VYVLLYSYIILVEFFYEFQKFCTVISNVLAYRNCSTSECDLYQPSKQQIEPVAWQRSGSDLRFVRWVNRELALKQNWPLIQLRANFMYLKGIWIVFVTVSLSMSVEISHICDLVWKRNRHMSCIWTAYSHTVKANAAELESQCTVSTVNPSCDGTSRDRIFFPFQAGPRECKIFPHNHSFTLWSWFHSGRL